MNGGKSIPVSLRILDKDYVIACPVEEQDRLVASAQYFNKKIQEVREGGKVVSAERIAVISALNIIHEYFQYQQQREDDTHALDTQMMRLQEKTDQALRYVKESMTPQPSSSGKEGKPTVSE